MSLRSVHSVSKSVLKSFKVFRTFCSATLHYFVKFIFANCHKQQHFAVFIFWKVSMGKFPKKIRQKLISQKLVLAISRSG